MLSRLESDGLITRERDWKTNYISLTELGRAQLERVYPAQVELQGSIFEQVLDADEQKQLHKLMRKLHRHSEERFLQGNPND